MAFIHGCLHDNQDFNVHLNVDTVPELYGNDSRITVGVSAAIAD